MHKCVSIERHPLGPTENATQDTCLDRRNRVRKVDMSGELERKPERLIAEQDFSVTSSGKEGELVQVRARIEKIVLKPDLEVILSFLMEETCGTVEMFANFEIYDYDKKNEAKLLLHGEKIPVGDLGRFILKDTHVLALVYWRSSRVVTTGKRWKVAKLWKPDAISQVDIYSLTSWDSSLKIQINPEKSSDITRRSRSCQRKRSTSPSKRNWRASSEPPKTSPNNKLNQEQINRNPFMEKKGDSYQDLKVFGTTFSWETLLKRRIGCNVKSVNMRLPDISQPVPIQCPASTSLPSSPTGNFNNSDNPQILPLCLFAVPAVISDVKQGVDGIEVAFRFNRMWETHEALMTKKYLSALTLDGVTETWRNVHDMLVPGLEVAIDVKNILFNKERKWLVFGLYLGKLLKSKPTHFIENNASRKQKMKMKEEARKKGITTVEKDLDQEEIETKTRYNKQMELTKIDAKISSLWKLQDELHQLRMKTPSQNFGVIQDNVQLKMTNEDHNATSDDEEQLDFGASLLNQRNLDCSLSNNEGDWHGKCDHKFDYSGAISEIESTNFTLIGPFGERWIKAKLNALETNIYNDGVRINEPSDIASFLKKAKGAMGNLVTSKCLKCSDFKMSDEGDLIVEEACLAWFGIDNAPWIQGDVGKVAKLYSVNEGKESLAVIELSHSSSKVWYTMSQHTGPPLSIGLKVHVWAFRECTEAYYIGAAVVAVPGKTSENPKMSSLHKSNQPTSDHYDEEQSWPNECSLVNPSIDASRIDAEIEESHNTAMSDGSVSSTTSTSSFIINEIKMTNPSEGSLSSIISPLYLDNCSRISANASDMFSFSPYNDNLYPLNVSDFEEKIEKGGPMLIRRPPRSLPSPTDSEFSEVDYRGTFAQIDTFKRRESAEKKVTFQRTQTEVELSDHVNAGVKNELTQNVNEINYHEDILDKDKTEEDRIPSVNRRTAGFYFGESEDEVFLPIHISTDSDSKFSNQATGDMDNNDENWKAAMSKLMLKDNKINKQLKSCDDFYKLAKIESTFETLVRDNSMRNLLNPVIDTQFEMILYINQLDSNQIIDKHSEVFNECYGTDDWSSADPVKRVGRFTVFGEDNPEEKATSLLECKGPTEEYLEHSKETLMLSQSVEKHKRTVSLKVLPPIPEENETCSDATSKDDSSGGSDGLEYSMSWTYNKSDANTPSPTKLIRYTSTPHLNSDEGMLDRGFTSDSSHSLTKSFTVRDSDSGFGESNSKNMSNGNSLCSSGEKEKKSKLPMIEEKGNAESNLQKSKLLVKKNLEEFLSFTNFPEEHSNALVEKFMNSGKLIL